MPKVAKVIVDVPVMQTNKPFEYLVPAEMEDTIVKGMRVEVPFNYRKIQGFVVDITDKAEYEGQLKEVGQPLDIEPVLNEELIALGEAMAEKIFSYRIFCYQTMLPAMLKASYEKNIYLTDELDEAEEQLLFKGRGTIAWKEAEAAGLLPRLLKLRREGKVDVQYLVKNEARIKKVTGYRNLLSLEQLEDELAALGKTAPKQRELLIALMQLGEQPLTSRQFQEQYGVSPAVLKAGTAKQWLGKVEMEVERNPYDDDGIVPSRPRTLTADQQKAFESVRAAIAAKRHEVFLLQGVTGSGKTEIYMQLIAEVLKNKKTAMMLVPEIALTPQMVQQFKSRFGDRVAVMHSGLSKGEKYDEWRKIRRGDADVVVGARSSIFSPVENLGMVIIDEEHESSYKQEDNPKYHARNVAVWRGEYHNCPVVLGSATPSLESRARAQKQVYTLIELGERVNQSPMPAVEVVDMKEEFRQQNRSNFSRLLQEKIRDRLAKHEQIVLLLNRRGFSSFIMCRDCGYVHECPNCDISLTMHLDSRTMKCHYCGHEEAIPSRCPHCDSSQFRYFGTGTQKVQEELKVVFPEARVIRMDVDTTRKKGAHEKLLNQFGNKEADILLGTQMIAKGLDFPDVTLVGVINADTSLSLPDFRSSEKTFQLLTQVSGRAGRADKPGEVVVQSYNPDHYAIQYARRHEYNGFYRREMTLRHQAGYPPYYFTTLISVNNPDEGKAQRKIYEINAFLRNRLSGDTIILGPSKGSIAKINNRYYFQILIKYKHEPKLQAVLQQILDESQEENANGLYISIDTEPVNFF